MKILLRAALCCALVLTAAAAPAPAGSPAGATITVTHELDAARPGAIVSVPFAEIAKVAPGLRMYHVVVRDSKGHVRCRCRSLTTSTIIAALQYDDLVFSYDFAAGEKRATFTLEIRRPPPRRPRRPASTRASCPSASTTWPGKTIASRIACTALALNTPAAGGERLRGSGIDVWAKRVTLSRSSIAGTPRATTSSTRTRKAKASTSTASAARAARAAPASGTARSSGPPTTS